MGYRGQKNFITQSSAESNERSRLFEYASRTIEGDNKAIRKEQPQSGTGVLEGASTLSYIRKDMVDVMLRMVSLKKQVINLSEKLKDQEKSNKELRSELEIFGVFLCTIIVGFLIVICVTQKTINTVVMLYIGLLAGACIGILIAFMYVGGRKKPQRNGNSKRGK